MNSDTGHYGAGREAQGILPQDADILAADIADQTQQASFWLEVERKYIF